MKRLAFFMLCAFAAMPLLAQPKHPAQCRQGGEDKIQAEKIAFFTSYIDLTPEDAQVFWPIYNQYWKEVMAAHKTTMIAFRQMLPEGTVSDDSKIEAYFDALEKEQQIVRDYYPKFKEVLPIDKVARIYQAEEMFKMKMLHKLRQPAAPAGESRDKKK